MARALCTAIDTEWGEVLLRVAVRAAMVQYRDICCEIATVLNSLSLSVIPFLKFYFLLLPPFSFFL